MEYRFTGRSGLKLPVLSLGLWQNFGTDRPEETQRAILRRAFDRGVTHFDLANNYGPPYGRAEENFGRYLRRRLRALPRRAGHLHQGRLGHVAGPLRPGRGRRKYVLASPRPVAAPDGAGLRRHLLQPPLRPRDAGRGDDDGARPRGAAGQGVVRRHLVVLRRQDAGGGHDRPGPRHAAADPPAVVLDAQPLDRGGPARRAGGAGDGLHRLHRAGPGGAHRQVPRRRPRRLAGRARGLDDRPGTPQRADAAARPPAQRDRAGARARSSPSWRSSGRCATPG